MTSRFEQQRDHPAGVLLFVMIFVWFIATGVLAATDHWHLAIVTFVVMIVDLLVWAWWLEQ